LAFDVETFEISVNKILHFPAFINTEWTIIRLAQKNMNHKVVQTLLLL